MTCELKPLHSLSSVIVSIPVQTTPTIRKTAILAAKIIGLLTAGAGIGYLIAFKTIENASYLENSPITTSSPEDSFWDGCCRPLFDFIGCLQQRGIPNFSYILNQCPSSPNCDP
ncbi:hypothetical protein [Candidatus Rhabdochlamydia sp. T3358]|uniref:hypothetical protein n=1 Tax=Candidatus Rhabdochlamydia sp. T3358 TaxID=2099795 RepID=UPI0010BA24B9|nr:hypothetical protein [Candidatus Rhabdochlamydia sp. T3358]VHO00891.1 hypothetical protein RHT_00221 [Candidatus Rhabdochlamydia sp. T3358]